VTAETADGVVMAVEHTALPLAAVQFHPESIMSLGDDIGIRLIRNVVAWATAASDRPTAAGRP
jgi:anthranilate synthase